MPTPKNYEDVYDLLCRMADCLLAHQYESDLQTEMEMGRWPSPSDDRYSLLLEPSELFEPPEARHVRFSRERQLMRKALLKEFQDLHPHTDFWRLE